MPNLQASGFPVVEEVTTLWRSIINDTFPGIANQQGRIATDSAPFTLPYLNSAFRKLQRELRNEGVTFPIKNVYILNLPALANQNPGVEVSLGFDGFFDGQGMNANPYLPGDCMQVEAVWQQVAGSGLPYSPMLQPQQGIPSQFQGQVFFWWEWRQYKIFLNGSLETMNLRVRYKSGQPPINVPAADFATTPIYILDCQDALANLMAHMYGTARGASDASLAAVKANAEEAISEMALEWTRRAQTVNYARSPYGGGGSGTSGAGFIGGDGSGVLD